MCKKIMIIDDDPDLFDTLKTVFKKMLDNVDIIYAKDGKKCFELLENNETPDLILLDIMMPGMNGWEVFARLKEKQTWNSIPVVFLTAKTDSFSKGMGGFSAEDYITKPFDLDYLKEKIYSLLEEEKK